MIWKRFIENIFLRHFGIRNIEGPLRLDKELFRIFFSSPMDPLPNFQGGRVKDHPRYGRLVYAFAKFYKPDIVIEVGTFAGGTAVGWAKALKENRKGRLICIDNDTYVPGTYPEIARKNILEVGLEEERFDLRYGDSKEIIPQIEQDLREKVDIYLVDSDHHYECALVDIQNGLPLMKSNGLILVHDVDINRKMVEATELHPYPVYEAFKKVIDRYGFDWCILRFIRKHLGVIKVRK